MSDSHPSILDLLGTPPATAPDGVLLMLLLSIIGAQRLSRPPPCPSSCVVCSEDAVICHRLTHIIDAPDSTQALFLTEGSITTVQPSSLSDLSNITLIGLSHNLISELDKHSFRNLSFLHTLLLDHNLLTSEALQGRALTKLAHLEVLSLANNHISMIEAGWFEGTRALQTLQMEGNLLTRLDSNSFPLNDFTDLEKLDLSDNLIEHLDRDSFHGLVSLRSLDLSRNRLSSAPAEAFSYLSLLTDLNLDLNTWNCSCQLLELSAFLSHYMQQPDKVLYNGRRMVCLSADNPSVTTVLELTEANCIPSNQNITLQIEMAQSVTPQLYARDLAITAVVCFAGGVGLTLLVVVLIYHQVSRRKKLKGRDRQSKKVEEGSTMTNHTFRGQDGSEKRKDLANTSWPWAVEEETILNHSDRFRSGISKGGSHLQCPNCIAEKHRGVGPHMFGRDRRMYGGMKTEEDRETRRTGIIEEGRRRPLTLQHSILNSNSIVTGHKSLHDGGSTSFCPTHRETATQNSLPTHMTSREMDFYRSGIDGKNRTGYEMVHCEGCYKTYEYRASEQTDRQGKHHNSMRDAYLFNTSDSQHRLSNRGGTENDSCFDVERSGRLKREIRNVTFDLESVGTPEERNIHRGSGEEGMKRSGERERGGKGGRGDRRREEGSGRHRVNVQSSRTLRVKMNLNPLRRSKVHPKKKAEQGHKDKSSPNKEKRSKEQRRDAKKGKGEEVKRVSSEKKKKSKTTKTEALLKNKEDEKEEEERQKNTMSSQQKKSTSKTAKGFKESSEGDKQGYAHLRSQQSKQTPIEVTTTRPTDQSDPNRGADDSGVGQQAGNPISGQASSVHGLNISYHANNLALQSSQLYSQSPFPLSDRTHPTNLSLQGTAGSQLTGSLLSLHGGTALSNMPQTAKTMFPSNTSIAIAPNAAYGGLGILNPNTACTGNLQGGLGLNSTAASLLTKTKHSNPLLGNTVNASSVFTSHSGGLTSNLATNPLANIAADPAHIQTQQLPGTISQESKLRSDPSQGPELKNQEGEQHPPAPQTPVLQTTDSHSAPLQAQGSLVHQAPSSTTEKNLTNENTLTHTDTGALSVLTGSLGGEFVTPGLASIVVAGTSDASAGAVSGANMNLPGVSVLGVSASDMSTGVVPAVQDVSSVRVVSLAEGGSSEVGASAAGTLVQQEYLSEEGGSSPRRKLRLVLPEKTSSRPPTALEKKIR